MSGFWILFTMPLAGLLYVAYTLLRTGETSLPHSESVPSAETNPSLAAVSRAPCREMKWITVTECERLLHQSDNIIFIDLQPRTVQESMPFPAVDPLTPNPSQLLRLLRWVPDANSIVISGGSAELYRSIFCRAYKLPGHAAIYFLHSSRVPCGKQDYD